MSHDVHFIWVLTVCLKLCLRVTSVIGLINSYTLYASSQYSSAQRYKKLFMLISTEHEIYQVNYLVHATALAF